MHETLVFPRSRESSLIDTSVSTTRISRAVQSRRMDFDPVIARRSAVEATSRPIIITTSWNRMYCLGERFVGSNGRCIRVIDHQLNILRTVPGAGLESPGAPVSEHSSSRVNPLTPCAQCLRTGPSNAAPADDASS